MPALNVRTGMRTPWGVADHVREIADGIWVVSTPGHGGIKLSASRNASINKAWRFAGGWYEEDLDANIVIASFPAAFDITSPTKLNEIMQPLRDYYPDAFQAVYGVRLSDSESRELRRRTFARDTYDCFVVRSAFGDWHDKVPSGMVGVIAARESDKTERRALVKKESYQVRSEFGYVLKGDEPIWNEEK